MTGPSANGPIIINQTEEDSTLLELESQINPADKFSLPLPAAMPESIVNQTEGTSTHVPIESMIQPSYMTLTHPSGKITTRKYSDGTITHHSTARLNPTDTSTMNRCIIHAPNDCTMINPTDSNGDSMCSNTAMTASAMNPTGYIIHELTDSAMINATDSNVECMRSATSEHGDKNNGTMTNSSTNHAQQTVSNRIHILVFIPFTESIKF